ncbi:MAG: riboflavin biosynthesis protein RibF, partial [Candidatus Omnitrophica bacterium]|nr:riboflavin biosynthesis protein RibF [Candidatus Omnitrophota bacterium]
MKVIYNLGENKEAFCNAVLVIGVFDGVHIGHQKLIQSALKRAVKLKGEVVVMTFSPHPVHVLRPDVYLPLIVSLQHRLKLIADMGVEKCIVMEFTKEFAQLTPQQFVKDFLVRYIQPKEVFVGDDFRFGKNRSGALEDFQKIGETYDIKVNGIGPIGKDESQKIGSSMIRDLIFQGHLDEAAELLGRPVSIYEKVQSGDGRGKQLGFPTANFYPKVQIIPPVGVYAVNVVIEGELYRGMANIGKRPSFHKDNSGVNVEVHIFDFNDNL